MTMRNIKLYGHLGRKFGKLFRMDVNSTAEAIAALKSNLEGFEAYLAKHNAPGYHIVIGNKGIDSEKDLLMPCGRGDIKIIPAVAGAKKGGFLQTVFGIVLVVVGVIFQNPYLVSAGISLIIGGVVQMLTVQPKPGNREKPENTPSYAFNGAVNTTAQGNPVPVCYGELIVGSQVISFGLAVDDIIVQLPNGGGGNGGDYGDGTYTHEL